MFGFREGAARPVWLFSIGPLGDPPEPEDPEPQELAAAATAIGEREHRVFTGRLDRAALNRRERLMVRAVRAPDGDFRDWGEITARAHSIAVALGRPPVTSANP
jgi:menaquinone-dependent protoporphyrinogen oxidase